MNSQEIKEAARGQWQYILPRVGIPASSLKNKHQPCPMCGGKDRFRFDDKQGLGTWFCNQCGSGDGFAFIMQWQSCHFSEALETVARVLGLSDGEVRQTYHTPAKAPEKQPESDKIATLQRIWQEAKPLQADDPVCFYLRQRGINTGAWITPPSTIRFHAALPYWTQLSDGTFIQLGTYAAMISRIDDIHGELQGLHLTYLQAQYTRKDNKGSAYHAVWQKAEIRHPETGLQLPVKKMRTRTSGSLNGASVQLFSPSESKQTGSPPETHLIVAEGIETALAASELFGLPAWAALSANGIKQFEPPENTRILIVADNDIPRPVGYEAAHDLAVKLIKRGCHVQIWQPEIQGRDALDELNAKKRNLQQRAKLAEIKQFLAQKQAEKAA